MAPYIAQRVTNVIRHIHQQLQFYLLNYVNDFLGAEDRSIIWEAFNHLTTLLQELGVNSTNKIVPPTNRTEFLGITVDAENMTMKIPKDKIEKHNRNSKHGYTKQKPLERRQSHFWESFSSWGNVSNQAESSWQGCSTG